eukprot:gnl/TRDRNA2_/TRDRNA2_30181_c0_seq2.p1 gnl/TRDRNA2_/TRDRNA2_30181_c0~~gnl/TRDRNA2_/TRDRNA2_30181_c0_seq2.p1  ORF type:complete len:325 (+),score=35.20 gnl/TRDRNA2_/TRDRNA2_30181_c0_seq2:387-1361(+)
MSLGVLVVLANCGTTGTSTICGSGYICSPSWTRRLAALGFLMATLIIGGLSSWRWLTLAGYMLHVAALGERNKAKVCEASANHALNEVPSYIIGTACIWDQFRIRVAVGLWLIVFYPARFLVNRLLPEELLVFGSGMPFCNLGEGVDLGVAAHFMPPSAKRRGRCGSSSRKRPEHFACEVSYVDLGHSAGLSDLQMMWKGLRDEWVELKQPQTKGLVASVVAIFPHVQGSSSIKQVSFASWQCEALAEQWQAGSRGKNSLLQYRESGRLKTFGSLLTQLRPIGHLRHQDRCSNCARLVESESVGDMAPSWCSVCGAETFRYPWF